MHTIGRFAPSPSGRMHLGNVLCALLAWLSARQQNGEFLLRIEDLDEMRCPRSFADLIIDDLRWLGLDWDGEIPYQSERTAVYEKYEAILREKGLLYHDKKVRRGVLRFVLLDGIANPGTVSVDPQELAAPASQIGIRA